VEQNQAEKRWILFGANGNWMRFSSLDHALDASSSDDVIYFEKEDGTLVKKRRGIKSSQTHLR